MVDIFIILDYVLNGWYKLASQEFIALEKEGFMHQNQVMYAWKFVNSVHSCMHLLCIYCKGKRLKGKCSLL